MQRLSRIPKMGLFLANRQTKRCGCAKKSRPPGGRWRRSRQKGICGLNGAVIRLGKTLLNLSIRIPLQSPAAPASPRGTPLWRVPSPFVGSLNRMTWRKRRLVSSIEQDGCVKKHDKSLSLLFFEKQLERFLCRGLNIVFYV